MITDRPAAAGENAASEILKLRNVSSIKSPILEFIQQIINYKDIIPRDESRTKPHQIKLSSQCKLLPPPMKIADPHIIQLKQRLMETRFN